MIRIHSISEVYGALLLLVGSYALVFGGSPERTFAALYSVASLGSGELASRLAHRFSLIEAGVFTIDVMLLACLFVLMLKANRFWTIWICSMQAITVLSHLPMLFVPDLIPLAYRAVITIWAYPMLALLAIATWRHSDRLQRYGTDTPWSSFSAR